MKLSDQVTSCLSDSWRSDPSSGHVQDSQAFKQLQQLVENLKVKYFCSTPQ